MGKTFAQTPQYDIIKYDRNLIEYGSRKAFDTFYEQWKNNSNQKIVIAHFGDSYVHPDYFTGLIRKQMQMEKGNAGRGMIFPYSMAKTYSQSDYSSAFFGNWKTGNSIQIPPLLPVGVSGFNARTEDENAGFKFSFKNSFETGKHVLKFYCNRNSGYKMNFVNGNEKISLDLDASFEGNQDPFIVIQSNSLQQEFEFELIKKQPDKGIFETYGIILERDQPGVIYHNLGVGGAAFSALNYQKYFEEQFPSLDADLVILDWGSNDILYTNQIDPELERTIRKTIQKVRKSKPDATIMLTSAIDMWRKGIHTTAASKFSALVRKIAFEENCLLYDWFYIAGGPQAMSRWVSLQLAQKDHIHLTIKGSELKGELFMEALYKTIDLYEKGDPVSSLILPVTPEMETLIDSLEKQAVVPEKNTEITKETSIKPAVKKATIKKPIKKAPPKKPVKKASIKKKPTKKPVKKTPAKKPVKKAPARKPVKKTPVRKPVKKTSGKKPAKKAPAKKPVKKATTKKN